MLKNGKVIAVVNNKGGVGKTTTVKNLAYELSLLNKNVLIIDCDSQRNATKGLSNRKFKYNVVDYVNGRRCNCIFKTRLANIDIIPGSEEMNADVMVEGIFLNKITELKCRYDYIVFDTSPSFNNIIREVMLSTDLAIIPVELEQDSFDGMMKTINQLQQINARALCKVLFTKVDDFKSTTEELERGKKSLSNFAFDTHIVFDWRRLKRARLHVVPVSKKYKFSKIGRNYKKLAKEILKEVF